METIRELLIAIGLDVHQAEWVEAIGLEKLLEKGAELLVDILKEIPTALVEVVHGTAEYAHGLEDASERTGIATDKLQEFGYIAGLAGLSTGDMEISVNHLARTMEAAKNGNQEAINTFARLGTHVVGADGKLRDVNAVLLDLSDGLHNLPPGADRTSAAMGAFGRSGAKMVNILGKGKAGVAALTKEFNDLGLGMSEDAIQKAAELEMGLIKIGAVFEMLKHELAGPLIEALGPVVDTIIDWVKENRELIRSRILQFSKALVSVFKTLWEVLKGVASVVGFLVDNFRLIAVVVGSTLLAALLLNIGAIATAVSWYAALSVAAVVAAVRAAAAWLVAAAPFILIAALIAIAILALEDFYTFLKGGDSIFGDLMIKWSRAITDFKNGVWNDLVAYMKETLNNLWNTLPGPVRFMLETAASPAIAGYNALTAPSVGVPGTSNSASSFQMGDINVTVPAGSNPEAVGQAVFNAINQIHDQKMREAAGAHGH